jgi:phosphatidylglycerol:prolipoprotein diacylglycerol transferase
MYQILFRIPQFIPLIGGMPIYAYGVMLVVGFFASIALAKFLARRSNIDPEIFANAALIALLAGIVGARLSHVLENFHDYSRPDLSIGQNLFNAINIREGGLTFYGGFLLAFPAVLAYGIYKKVPIRLGMDIIAPCVLFGLGFGRIGCFLNGCCYGAQIPAGSHVSWAVQFPYRSDAYLEQAHDGEIQIPPQLMRDGVPLSTEQIRNDPTLDSNDKAQLLALANSQRALPVHPAELYSTFTAWLIAAFLVAYFTLPHAPGRVFAAMLILEGVSRFLLETVRAEPPILGSFSFSMVVAIPLIITGIGLWIFFGMRSLWKDIPQPRSAVVPAAVPA